MKVDIREWKVIWYFFRPYRVQSLVVLGVMFLSGFMEMLNLAALYPIINYGLNVQTENFALIHFERVTMHISPGNPLLASCISLVAISVLSVGFKFIHHYFSHRLTVQIVGDTQKKIMDKFIAAEYNFYVKNQQGKLIYAGTSAPERMSISILSAIRLLHNVINTLFLIVLLVLLSWKLTGLLLLAGLLYGMVIKRIMQKVIYRSSEIYVAENQNRNIILNELITGIKSIKVYLSFDEWKKRHTHSVERGLFHRFRVMMGRVSPEMFMRFLFYILIALTGIVLSRRPYGEIIALLPMLGTFVVVVNRFLPYTNLIGTSLMSMVEYIPDTRIVHDLCTEEFTAVPEGKMDFEHFSNEIVFEDLWFKYDKTGEYLLKNISFSIAKKKMTAVVGSSGSGKTTIINLLLKLYHPDRGAIRIDGADIFDLNNRSYLSRIGYVSQETFIFNSSFKENIRFGMNECTDQMIEEAAKLANAHEFIMNTKNGYETIVGDAGVKLSGGQRQRVAIARAMLRKPEIIVLDEATSSLDNISERKIQAAINNISKHTTVLVIAHRLSTVQNADKIVVLDRGEIREQGTHEELLNNRSAYYDLYMSQESVGRELVEKEVV